MLYEFKVRERAVNTWQCSIDIPEEVINKGEDSIIDFLNSEGLGDADWEYQISSESSDDIKEIIDVKVL
jgi:hypothetical protein